MRFESPVANVILMPSLRFVPTIVVTSVDPFLLEVCLPASVAIVLEPFPYASSHFHVT